MSRVIHAARRRPRHLTAFLVACGFLWYLLASCASTKQHPVDERPALLWAARPVAVDSLRDTVAVVAVPVAGQPKPSLFRRLFPQKQQSTHSQSRLAGQPVPKKCKGCQFTIIQGNDNKVSQASAGKVKAPTVQASDSATQTTAGPNTQQVVTAGDGNQVDANKQDTTQEAKDWKATMADNATKWVPWVLGVLAFAAAGALVWYMLPYLPKRKKDETENQA